MTIFRVSVIRGGHYLAYPSDLIRGIPNKVELIEH